MSHTSRAPRTRGARRQLPVCVCAAPTAAERPQACSRPVEEAKVWTATV